MRSFTLHDDMQILQGQEFHPITLHSYTIKGRCSTLDDGRIEVRFALLARNGGSCQYFEGHIGKEGYLTGYYSYTEGPTNPGSPYLYTFYRIPAEILACRPLPAEFTKDRARALWAFARNALLFRARRKLFSWSFFKDRRDRRRRFLALGIRKLLNAGPPLTDEELVESKMSGKLIPPVDYILYRSQLTFLMYTTPKQ